MHHQRALALWWSLALRQRLSMVLDLRGFAAAGRISSHVTRGLQQRTCAMLLRASPIRHAPIGALALKCQQLLSSSINDGGAGGNRRTQSALPTPLFTFAGVAGITGLAHIAGGSWVPVGDCAKKAKKASWDPSDVPASVRPQPTQGNGPELQIVRDLVRGLPRPQTDGSLDFGSDPDWRTRYPQLPRMLAPDPRAQLGPLLRQEGNRLTPEVRAATLAAFYTRGLAVRAFCLEAAFYDELLVYPLTQVKNDSGEHSFDDTANRPPLHRRRCRAPPARAGHFGRCSVIGKGEGISSMQGCQQIARSCKGGV